MIVRLGYHFVEFLEVETSEVQFLVALGDLRFQVHEALESIRKKSKETWSVDIPAPGDIPPQSTRRRPSRILRVFEKRTLG